MSARERIMQLHPHVAQAFRGLNPPSELEQQPFRRKLEVDAPRLKYHRRNMEVKSVISWAQRKLFLQELEFLTRFSSPNDVVVYAGAFPGNRIAFLSQLFPDLIFILVDADMLFLECNDRLIHIQQKFNDALARELRNKYGRLDENGENIGSSILFIPNSSPSPIDQDREAEEDQEASVVQTNMEDQLRWHLLMQPIKSLFKFALPYTPGNTYYVDGEVYLPIWGGATSTETRLVPNNNHRVWDHTEYEEQMFYFNTRTRIQIYQHGIEGEGLDGCYDCTAETQILRKYLLTFPQLRETALGSQINVMPEKLQPATRLKLANALIKPAIVPNAVDRNGVDMAKKGEVVVLESVNSNDNSGGMADDAKEQNVDNNNSNSDGNAADGDVAVTDSNGENVASVEGQEGGMEDAEASSGPIDSTELDIARFSQEVSRRIADNGRTLKFFSDLSVKKAIFAKKRY